MLLRGARVDAPGGDTWTVRTFRVRLPGWRRIELEDEPLNDRDIFTMLFNLIALPFTLVLIPLLIVLVQLPGALLTALRSDDAWVEAASYWPHEERYLWRTSRGDAPAVRAAVIEDRKSVV